MDERRYEYRPKLGLTLLCIGMFGGLAYFFAHLALANDRGAIINHLIELEEGGATILYWVFAGIGVTFVLLGCAALVRRYRGTDHTLIIGPSSVYIPGSLLTKSRSVDFEEIIELREVSISGTIILEMKTRERKYGISNRMFTQASLFVEARDEIKRRVTRSLAARAASAVAT